MPIILNPVDAYRLHDPQNSANNIALNVVNPPLTSNIREEQALFNPLGRKNVIIVRDVVRGQHWTVHLEFLTQADYNAFINIRNQQRSLFLIEAWTNRSWYVAIGEMLEIELYNYGPDTYRLIGITLEEQDVPT